MEKYIEKSEVEKMASAKYGKRFWGVFEGIQEIRGTIWWNCMDDFDGTTDDYIEQFIELVEMNDYIIGLFKDVEISNPVSEDLEHLASVRAETIGVVEYGVNHKNSTMEYISYYGNEGYYKVTYNLITGEETRKHLKSTSKPFNYYCG